MNMKKRYIYFLVGVLLCGLVITVFQISRATEAYPNPGHALNCHVVSANAPQTATAYCDYGTSTGGGCQVQGGVETACWKPLANGYLCIVNSLTDVVVAFAVCCEAGN